MKHLGELLSVFLDGEASPTEARRIQAHLSECIRCRKDLRDVNEARTALRALPMLDMPVEVVATDGRTAGRRLHRPAWLGVAAAAAAITVTVATIAAPSPPSIPVAELSRQYGARAALDAGTGSLKLVVPRFGDE